MDEREHEYEERGLPLGHVMVEDGDRRVAVITGAIGLALLLALGVVALVAGGDAPTWLFVVLGLSAVVLLIVMYHNARVWVEWGNPQLFLPSSNDLHLGDQVIVRFKRVARRGADIAGLQIIASVEAQEVIDGGGSEKAEIVFTARADVVLLSLVERTVEVDLAVNIPLSAASPTFSLGDFAVRWHLVVRIEAPNAADDDSIFPLVVAPVVAERVQSGGRGR